MPKDPPARSPSRVGSRRAIMALLELLGRRWTLRLLWELRNGPLTSRELRAACDEISPTVLQARVDDLREALILELGESGYQLTPLGGELLDAFAPLYAFAERWARALALHERSGR
jgi:DNA-binding HxlR family transcriptional regulator